MTQLAPDFDSLGLSSELVQALVGMGFTTPSPIQLEGIPVLLKGGNLLGVAQTGTGKTAAFSLPLLQRLDPVQTEPQIIVLTPTRELAIQVGEAIEQYAKHLRRVRVACVYGGQDIRRQLIALRNGVQVVVGTPGRIIDHIERGSLKLEKIRAVVLDEADEMLRMGFIEDVETILARTPDTAQRALFSATMPPAIRRVAKVYLGDAEEVRIASKTTTVEQIEQFFIQVPQNHKVEALARLLETEPIDGVLVFAKTKITTVAITDQLIARGFSVASLNGDLSQQVREKTIGDLKAGKINIVIATDVAARGLDVDRISHVINFDVPTDTEIYVHRIGRTGRAGREGKAILLITPAERRMLRIIEQATRQPITPMAPPTGEQMKQHRVARLQQEIMAVIDRGVLQEAREVALALAAQHDIGLDEIAAALIQKLPQGQNVLEKLYDVPQGVSRERSDAPRGERPRRIPVPTAMDRYRLEVGRQHNISQKDIVGALANEGRIDSKHIGRIELFDTHSTIELPKGMPHEMLRHLQTVRIRQHPGKFSLVGTAQPRGAERRGNNKPQAPKTRSKDGYRGK